MHIIEDLDEKKERWFEMEKGGRVQFRTIPPSAYKEIQRKTIKKKVEFKKIEGTPVRLEYQEINTDLQNHLVWDAVIGTWDGFSFRHPETKELIVASSETCTLENKILLMETSQTFAVFAGESIKVLAEEVAKEEEIEVKN